MDEAERRPERHGETGDTGERGPVRGDAGFAGGDRTRDTPTRGGLALAFPTRFAAPEVPSALSRLSGLPPMPTSSSRARRVRAGCGGVLGMSLRRRLPAEGL